MKIDFQPAVPILIKKLSDISIEEIGRIIGVASEMTKLKNSFALIQAVLQDASKRQLEDPVVKVWVNSVVRITYEADNLVDEFQYQTQRHKVETENQKERHLCCFAFVFVFFSFIHPLFFRSKMAHKIISLNENLETLYKQAIAFGLEKRIADSALTIPLTRETTSVGGVKVVGRENDISEILNIVLNWNERDVFVVPIVGMGGLGKTTLARSIFQHPEIINRFDERIWVCASTDFNSTKVFKTILDLLNGNISQDIAITTKLQQRLSGKRYLLVLDDLWNDNSLDWEDFETTLSGMSVRGGNIVITTTRLESIALVVTPHPSYPLGKLSDDDCWSLIKNKAFGNGQVPRELESFGKEIASKCGGLPLAANLIGSTLHGKRADSWASVLQNITSIPSPDVLQILKISYDRLPSVLLKTCFTYCSIFCKDAKIEKERVIQLWMAQGFLQENNEINMESLGSKVYDVLLESSFLQEPVYDKYGNVGHSVMHDLVHDLAGELSSNANSMENRVPTLVTHLTVKLLEEAAQIVTSDNAIYLRTLLLGSATVQDTFKDLYYLYVLDLSNADVEDLTGSIEKLIHLRFLDVSSTRINTLPDSVCKLYNLQTLRALNCNMLKKLPMRIYLLVNLRHFIIMLPDDLQMPLKIGKLPRLRTLPMFKVGIEKGQKIEELRYLKNLKGELKIYNLENVNDREEATKAELFSKPHIESLQFSWGASHKSMNNHEEVLENLQPHSEIRGLGIINFMGKSFPSWVMNMLVNGETSLNFLIEVRLVDCESCREVPSLGHLPLLKVLELTGLRRVKSIGPSFYHPDYRNDGRRNYQVEQVTPFRALTSFVLWGMNSLVNWVAPKECSTSSHAVGFPVLKHLKIEHCEIFKAIPGHDFGFLEELSIEGSVMLLPNMTRNNNLRSLTTLSVRNCNMNRFPSELFESSLRLKELKLYECHLLTHIEFEDENGGILQFLQTLKIERCDKLVSVGFKSGQPKCLPSLQNLLLQACRMLVSVTLAWQGISNINIDDCPRWRSLPQDMISGLLSLISLHLKFSHDKGRSIQAFKSSHKLKLFGREWTFVPHQLEHLTNLKELILEGSDVRVLPEWISKLSSLECLCLWQCEELRHLPATEVMQNFSNLKRLEIWNCQLLAERCISSQQSIDPDDESEWAKISQISSVYIH